MNAPGFAPNDPGFRKGVVYLFKFVIYHFFLISMTITDGCPNWIAHFISGLGKHLIACSRSMVRNYFLVGIFALFNYFVMIINIKNCFYQQDYNKQCLLLEVIQHLLSTQTIFVEKYLY